MSIRISRTTMALISTGALAIVAVPGTAHAATTTPSPTSSASATAAPTPTSTASAGPTVAQAGSEITKLPAKVTLTGGSTPAQFVTVKLVVPAGRNCAKDFRARQVAQSQAVTVSSSPDCTSAGFAKWTVTANSTTSQANTIVKFTGPNAAGQSRTIGTLTVKVNAGAKPTKPTKSATPTATASPTASSSTAATKPGKPVKPGKP
ncbi:MAG: hypothetical protein WC005_09225 [Candidatus Nanopelagicales bacterium]